MTLRYFYRDNDGDVVEMINPRRVRRTGTEASYQAEEGAVGTWVLEVDDPDGTFNVRGYRIVYAQEDEAIADDQHGIIGVWYTTDRTIGRMSSDSPAKRTEDGRTWQIQLNDLNTRFSWRINVGNDCDRPAESDLARVAWLMGTNEMSWLDDDDTYVDTGGTEYDMDAVDYTGQALLDVIDDCAQTSGRNYGLLWEYSGDPDDPIAIKLWYRNGVEAFYSSEKKINNKIEFTEADPDALYPSLDARLDRSPSRVAWGVYQTYDGGAVYETLASTAERFNKIDVLGKGDNVKSAGAASRRAKRYLATVTNVETDRIEVSVVVPLEEVNSILPFHRIKVWFSHQPGYQTLDEYLQPEYHWMRVVERTVRDRDIYHYELGLTLMAPALDEFPADEGGGEVDATWFAHIEGSSGPYPLPSGPIYWDKSLVQVGLPWWTTVGPFSYHDIADRDWPRYDGITVTADAFLASISMRATAIGVMLGANEPYTVTWEILQNDSVIASESVGPLVVEGASNLWTGGPIVTAANITCSAGDLISGRLTCTGANGGAMEFFRSPWGINAGQNILNINGGYLL